MFLLFWFLSPTTQHILGQFIHVLLMLGLVFGFLAFLRGADSRHLPLKWKEADAAVAHGQVRIS